MSPQALKARLLPRRAREVVVLWLVVRALWLAVALPFGQHQSPAAERFVHRDPAGHAYVNTPLQLLDMWTRQDAVLYAEIARDGYPHQAPWTLCAFFPLFPLLIYAACATTGMAPWLAGLLLGNVLDACGWIMLWCWLRRRLGIHRAGVALWAFAAFPSRNFGFSGYTEGPYLLAIATALWAWHASGPQRADAPTTPLGRAGLLLIMAVAAAAAAALRVPGVLLGLSLMAEGLLTRRPRDALCVGGAAAASLGTFIIFLFLRTGDALRFAHVQSQWHREFSYLGQVFVSDGKGPDHLGMWLGILGAALLWRRRAPLGERLFVSASLLLPMLTGNVMSMLRFVGVLVPLFAEPLARRVPRYALPLYFAVAGSLSVAFAISVGQGRRVM